MPPAEIMSRLIACSLHISTARANSYNHSFALADLIKSAINGLLLVQNSHNANIIMVGLNKTC